MSKASCLSAMLRAVINERLSGSSFVSINMSNIVQNCDASETTTGAAGPISLLPSELLSSIFVWIITDVEEGKPYNSVGCIPVLSVCKRWRELGLEDPRPWAYWSNFKSSRALQLFILRSKAAPLFIRLDRKSVHVDQAFMDTWQTFFQSTDAVDRVRELQIHLIPNSNQLLDAFDSCTDTKSVCQLHTLRFNGNVSPWDYLRVPKVFAARYSPNLSQIRLVRCHVDWDSPIFTSSILTHLVVNSTSDETRPTSSRLLGILKQQPMLECLTLGSWTEKDSAEPAEIVRLEYLKELCVNERVRTCMRLVENIVCPNVQNIRLCLERDTGVDQLDYTLPFLSRHYNSDQAPTIRCLSFKADPQNTRLTVNFWHREDIPPNSKSSYRTPDNICIRFCRHQRSYSDIFKRLIKELPLHHLRKLSLQSLEMTEADWSLAVLDSLVTVESLELFDDVFVPQASLLHAITVGPSTDFSASYPAQKGEVLPDLKRLLLRRFALINGGPFAKENGISSVVNFVTTRKEAEHGLKFLHLKQCGNVSMELLGVLRCLVDEVECDID